MQMDVPLPQGIRTPEDLSAWFDVRSGLPLAEAFARFDLPIALMQQRDAITRISREAVEDLESGGLRYAELRLAPLQHQAAGLRADDVVEAVLSGLTAARSLAPRLILCAMRTDNRTQELVRLAERWLDSGVVGIDLAGPEPGFPASSHGDAFALAKEVGLNVTIHAGEMDGVESIAAALTACHADRIGHGWRLIDDCIVRDGTIEDLGDIAQDVLDRAIPLEMCLTSNSCIGVRPRDHPFLLFLRAGFIVTLNTDNRTITRCTPEGEEQLAIDLGASDQELRRMQINAVNAAFDRNAATAGVAP
jgi:adenosine deaminase